jgi:hypothetical protein
MMTRNQLIAFVMTLVLVSVAAGFVVSFSEGVPPITQTIDGVQYVKTRDAGWQPVKPGDYVENLFGGLTQEYGWALDTAPVSLPNTSGNCETFVSCITGGF